MLLKQQNFIELLLWLFVGNDDFISVGKVGYAVFVRSQISTAISSSAVIFKSKPLLLILVRVYHLTCPTDFVTCVCYQSR